MTPRQIKQRMSEKRLTQEKLAKRFGVSQTAINFLVNGNLDSPRLQRRLARVLGVTLKEFRGELSEERKAS